MMYIYLRQLHVVWFVLLFSILGFAVMIFVLGFFYFLNIPDYYLSEAPADREVWLIEIITGYIIFIPLIETLLHQSLLYWLLSKVKYFRKHKVWIILISALVFGIAHFYSLHYIIYTFAVGIIFMYAYILRIGKKPYWTVFLIHALVNLYVYLIKIIE